MKKRFNVKMTGDGRAMLNCAPGFFMNWEWNNIDMYPYARLRQHPLLARALRTIGFLDGARWQKFLAVAPDIIWWDIRKGLPFDNCSLDVVYHSHFFEHLDRDTGKLFLKECYRVLKPNGTMRLVVPDLEHFIKEYTSTLSMLQQKDFSENVQPLGIKHLQSIYNVIGLKRSATQSNIAAGTGTEKQPPIIRRLERLIRGKAVATRKLMEHQWMYDRYSLRTLLSSIGFVDIRVEAADTSRIELWNSFNLDIDADGRVLHGPESLYMEARVSSVKTCMDQDDGKSSSG